MVADYMERQILGSSTEEKNETHNGTSTNKQTGDSTRAKSGDDVTTDESSGSNTRTLNTSQNVTGSQTHSGTDKEATANTRTDDLTQTRELDETRTDDLTQTRELSSTRTDNLTETGSHESSRSDISDSKSLAGGTPDSQTYGTGSQIGLLAPDGMPLIAHDTGAPGKLDWKYLSTQGENIGLADSVSREKSSKTNGGTVTNSDTGTVTDGGTVTTTQGGTLKNTGTVGDEGSREITHGHKVDDLTTRTDSGTIKDEANTGGTTTVKYGSTVTDTKNLTDTRTENGTVSGHTGVESDHRERYSGRHKAPPELLKMAQEYIVGSNAVKWLFRQLEPCFFELYESW